MAAAVVVALLALLAPGAIAGVIYGSVNLPGSKAVLAIDTSTNQVVGAPIEVGNRPSGIAIKPDGSRAYVANTESESVSVIDTKTNQVIGSPIAVGKVPLGTAITPDGSRVYVTNFESESVSVIDTRTNAVLTIPVEKEPEGIAVTPDGSRVYVSHAGLGSVSVIGTATNAVVGSLSGAAFSNPVGIAVTPDGSRVYIAQSSGAGTVLAFDAGTNQMLPGLTGFQEPEWVSIAPDGIRAYVTDDQTNMLSAFDTRTNSLLGAATFSGEPGPAVATPDGKRVYVAVAGSGVFVVDAQSNAVVAGPIAGTKGVEQLAIVPNQPPATSFSTLRARPGVPVAFNASTSKDSDGTVATYSWDFGDRKTTSVATPRTNHVYPRPGKYRVALTLTDNEGCSTALVFTGQTASCNGSAVASKTEVIKVAYPGVQVRCPRSAKPGGCKLKLRVVSKRGKKAKAQTAVARAKLKAGGSTIVSLKPRKAFRRKLARARSVLVERTQTIDGTTRTTVRKLKIVQ